MKNVVAILTLALFGAVALVLVIGGWAVIFPGEDAAAIKAQQAACPKPVPCEMPTAPDLPAPLTLATDTAAASQQISIYEHQVAAYKDRLAAYEKYLQTWASQREKGPDRLTRYQAVVKEALLPILNPLVAAFIAYAFAKGTANVVRNLMAGRRNDTELKDLDL